MEKYMYFSVYMLALVSSLLVFGMSFLIFFLRLYVKKGILYTKILQQWTGTFAPVFVVVFIMKLLISYLYFPHIFSNIIFMTFYTIAMVIALSLAIVLHKMNKNSMLAPSYIYFLFMLITCIAEISINIHIARAFFREYSALSMDIILNPTSLLLLLRLVPYSILLSSLVFILGIIVRRNKDNFGRDYYIFSLQYCTHLSFVAVVGLTIISVCNVFFFWIDLEATMPSSFATLLVLPTVVFIYLAYSFRRIRTIATNPLQYKFSYSISLLLSLMALCADIFLLQPNI